MDVILIGGATDIQKADIFVHGLQSFEITKKIFLCIIFFSFETVNFFTFAHRGPCQSHMNNKHYLWA